VKDEPDLGRCPESNAIININTREIHLAREAKRQRQMKEAERKANESVLQSKVDSLENDMRDIKSLLSQLVEKL
jgi:Flp pilus assembly secretin CpaC